MPSPRLIAGLDPAKVSALAGREARRFTLMRPKSARAMAKAGADMVVAHMGLTTAGSIGAKTARTLDDSVRDVGAIVDAVKTIRPDCLVICHGGPIAEPEDARYVLSRLKACDGFYGAKVMTARFYFARLLPESNSLFTTLMAGSDTLMAMPAEAF